MEMIFHQKIKVEWPVLKEKRQPQTIVNNAKENQKHNNHEYKVGNLVIIKYKQSKKAQLPSPKESSFWNHFTLHKQCKNENFL